MKNSLAIIGILVLGCSGVFGGITPRGVLDGIVTELIEDNLKPVLANLTISNIELSLNNSGIIGDVTADNITAHNMENFTIAELKTTLLPLRLDTLTLFWDEFVLSGPYSMLIDVDIDVLQGEVRATGDGDASITLRNLTLTAGANIGSPGGHLQIKEITKLHVELGSSVILLDNISFEDRQADDSSDMGLIINVFLSFFLSEFVNDSGDDILHAMEPTIIEKLNEVLANVTFPY